jgi:hypothetical protein
MAHFAKIENGIVTEVIVVNNDSINNLDFPESELIGKEFISSLNLNGEWIQTSYNNNFRNVFAGIGYTWNGTDFIAPEVELPVIGDLYDN